MTPTDREQQARVELLKPDGVMPKWGVRIWAADGTNRAIFYHDEGQACEEFLWYRSLLADTERATLERVCKRFAATAGLVQWCKQQAKEGA